MNLPILRSGISKPFVLPELPKQNIRSQSYCNTCKEHSMIRGFCIICGFER